MLMISFWGLFSTAIWVSHGQLWAIIEGTASLIRYQSLRFDDFDPKVTGNPVTRLGP